MPMAVALAIALGPAIAAIWSVPWFVTQDGPAHLYNARIIAESFDPASPYASAFAVRALPLPNWAGHVLYLAIGSVLPPAWAERAAATMTLVALTAATAWLRRRVVPEDGPGGTLGTATLAALLGLNVAWLFGFTGFLLGAALLPMTLGVWWSSRDRPGLRPALNLAALVTLGYFCHPVSLGLTAFGLVALAAISPGPIGRRVQLVRILIGLSPLLALGPLYLYFTREGGPMRPEWGYLAAPFSARAWVAQLGWADPISLAAKTQRPFGRDPSPWNGLAAPALWAGLGLAVLSGITLRDRDRGRRRVRVGWGAISLVVLLAGLFGPDTLGASHGHYLPPRVVLIGLVTLVPWLRLDAPGMMARLGRGALVVALILQSLFVWDYAGESRRTAGGLMEAAEEVGNDRRVAAVLLDIRGRFRSNPLLHADCLLGVGTGNVIWGDYETNYYYFPVRLRDPDASPPASALEAIARAEGPERARLWSALLDRHESAIDVVLIWGDDPEIEEATTSRFTLIWKSTDGRVQVYRRDGLG